MNTIYLENVSNMYVFIIRLLWNVQYTYYARPQHYPLNNDDHTRHAPWRYLFSMVLFVAEKSPQNAPSTREVSVFLTDPPSKSVKIPGLKNFHICMGSVFFNIILTMSTCFILFK